MYIENIGSSKIDIKTTNGNRKYYRIIWGLIEENLGKTEIGNINVLKLTFRSIEWKS